LEHAIITNDNYTLFHICTNFQQIMTKSVDYSPLENILVNEIMTKPVISVDSFSTSSDAAKVMEDSKVGAIVVYENTKPVGIITDRDLAIKIAAHSYPLDTPVRRIMSSPLITIPFDSTFRDAVDLMNVKKIRKLLVVNDTKVTGIITTTDLVNYLSGLTSVA
jgi:CBS domain-containing protein